jgi:hypothetical protein
VSRRSSERVVAAPSRISAKSSPADAGEDFEPLITGIFTLIQAFAVNSKGCKPDHFDRKKA